MGLTRAERRARTHRRVQAVAAGLVSGAVVAAPATQAAAYDVDPPGITSTCGFVPRDAYFRINETWEPTIRNAIIVGLQKWVSVPLPDGSPVVTLQEWSPGDPGPDVEIDRWAVGDPTPYGQAICSGGVPRLRINDEYDNSGDEALVQSIATHELGHALGLGHTGDDSNDDYDPDSIPVMATCGISRAEREARTITEDDRANLAQKRLGITNPNSGFEDTFLDASAGVERPGDWKATDGTLSTSYDPATPASGSRSADFATGDPAAIMLSGSRLAAYNLQGNDYATVTFGTWSRWIGSDFPDFTVEIHFQAYEYDDAAPGCETDAYSGGLDLNSERKASSDPEVLWTDTISPSFSWIEALSPATVLPTVDPDTLETIEGGSVAIRINGVDGAGVQFDETRLEYEEVSS